MILNNTTGYLSSAFDDLSIIIEKSIPILQNIDFDTIVGTGLSGTVVIPTIAFLLKKNFVIIRKTNDSTHSWKVFEGDLFEGNLGTKWIFVDDFIETGRTFNFVKNEIEKTCQKHNHDTTLIGLFLYANLINDSFKDLRKLNPGFNSIHDEKVIELINYWK